MFLHQLNNSERKAFIELAHLVANASGIINDQERQMIDTYSREMEISIKVEDVEELSLEHIIAKFESEASKKVSFIEAIAIAYADGVYEEEEKQVINRIREAYGFSQEYYEDVKAWLISFNEIYLKGLELSN